MDLRVVENWQLIDKLNKACVYVCTTLAAAALSMFFNKQTVWGRNGNLDPTASFLFFLNETETDLHILSYLTMALDMQIILVSFILRQSVSFLIQFRHRHNKTDKIQWKLVEVFSRFDGLFSICSCYVLWTTEIKKVLQNNPLHCTPVFALVLAQ